jgi:hypothetical protein
MAGMKWGIPRNAYAIFSPDGDFLFFSDGCPSPQFYCWLPIEVDFADNEGDDRVVH